MTFADFLAGYWWTIPAILSIFIPIVAIATANARSKELIRLMQSYAAQGKDPPPELVQMTTRAIEKVGEVDKPDPNGKWWTAIVFIAVAAGFGTAYWFIRGTEDYSWVFLMLTVIFSIMALGGLLIALFGRTKT